MKQIIFLFICFVVLFAQPEQEFEDYDHLWVTQFKHLDSISIAEFKYIFLNNYRCNKYSINC